MAHTPGGVQIQKTLDLGKLFFVGPNPLRLVRAPVFFFVPVLIQVLITHLQECIYRESLVDVT